MADLELKRVKVWDLPLRLFHWLLVFFFCVSWITGVMRDFKLHFISGYILLTLIIFRIIWGFTGSTHARFSDFVKGPKTVIAYVRRMLAKAPSNDIGHNPLGGWSVLALLVALLVQIGSGLMSTYFAYGSDRFLAQYFSRDWRGVFGDFHEIFFNALMALVIVHISAIAFYYFGKKNNLVKPMITGNKEIPVSEVVAERYTHSAWGFFALAVAAGITWLIVQAV